jgi:acylphosphatase
VGRLSGADVVRRAFTVTGRVQGVGFRWFTRDAALRLGVTGWVSNLADGSVAGEAEGSLSHMEEFFAALRRGPAGSSVSEVTHRDLDALANGRSAFEIRR